MTPEQIAAIRSRDEFDHEIGYETFPEQDRHELLAHIDTLTAAATKTRDRLAWWLWSEDDSGDSNDLVAAYDELRSILGPSTEEGVAATLAGESPRCLTRKENR